MKITMTESGTIQARVLSDMTIVHEAHEFKVEDGNLVHYIDSKRRAIVAPARVAEYVKHSRAAKACGVRVLK